MDKQTFVVLMNKLALGCKKYAPDFTDKAILQVWYADLQDIPDHLLQEACEFARKNLDEFPSIAWIRRKCKGSTRSYVELGKEIAARIEKAIIDHGHTNADWAAKSIGDLGWEVVKQCGGWNNVCDIESMSALPALRKQWRDIGSIVCQNFYEKGENSAPALPHMVDSRSDLRIG